TKRNRLIKIILEGFLPENGVIISGLLKENFDAHEVLYLADNFDVSFVVGQRFIYIRAINLKWLTAC
ncbi:hypothetical protein DUF68_22475, partial [Salmonella enterica]|nr:hypothetical protein [Salmonella enterica]